MNKLQHIPKYFHGVGLWLLIEQNKIVIVSNPVRLSKDQQFSAKVSDFVITSIYFMKHSMLLLHMTCTYPPQCSKLLIFSAFLVRLIFQKEITARVVERLKITYLADISSVNSIVMIHYDD